MRHVNLGLALAEDVVTTWDVGLNGHLIELLILISKKGRWGVGGRANLRQGGEGGEGVGDWEAGRTVGGKGGWGEREIGIRGEEGEY